MTRSMLRWLARGLIGSLLMMQLALAAHACMVGLSSPAASAVEKIAVEASERPQRDEVASPQAVAGAADPCFGAADDSSSNLCHEHCKQGQQGDKTAGLIVPMACLSAWYLIAPPPDDAPLRCSDAAHAERALAVGQPPHAILHCVLRT